MTRTAYEEWQEQGSKDAATRIQEKLRDIVENHAALPLPDKTLAGLKAIRRKGESELLK
jgi:trimethylamine:corrinoid methyltransferase-like protein